MEGISAWLALKMIFGIIPGLCLIAYAFECGLSQKPFRISELKKLWKEVNLAKKEAIKNTGKIISPEYAKIITILIFIVLLLIIVDSIMLIAFNFTAIPVSFISYSIGRKNKILSKYNGKKIMKYVYKKITILAIQLLLIWLVFVAFILAFLFKINIWQP